MTRCLMVVILVAGLGCNSVPQGTTEESLEQLLEAGRWFELRDALEGTDAPALYRGAVAVAFHRVEDAEASLRQAIREASNVDIANQARELLAVLYLRLGRSSEAGRVFDELLQVSPDRSDIESARVLFGAFSTGVNQTVEVHRPATFPCVVNGSVKMPLSVNGTTVTWLFDTGASTTMLSESEAEMLGLIIDETTATAGDLAGGTTPARRAVADRVVIGGTELRNVSMLALPDSQPPWNELESGERGVIGLPVILALETVRWTRAGTCRTGPTDDPSADALSNLAFDQLLPVTRVESEGRPLDFVFDTGNEAGTQLWERFAQDFAALVDEHGRPSTIEVIQIGGAAVRPVVVVPDIPLQVGGLEMLLSPANVFSQPVGNRRQHGLLGKDVFGQADEITLDFRTMPVTMR